MPDLDDAAAPADARFRALERRLDAVEAALGPNLPAFSRARPPSPRRFGIRDLMVLVAFAAPGLAGVRPVSAGLDGFGGENLGVTLMSAAAIVTPPAATWGVAVLALRLMRPRPGLARAFRQPGVVSAASATAVLFAVVPLNIVSLGLLYEDLDFDAQVMAYLMIWGGKQAGFAVLGVRLALWVTGRNRPTADWVDRLGRVLSWYWIAVALLVPPFG